MAKNTEPPETRSIRDFHNLGKEVLTADEQSKPLAGGKQHRGVAREFKKRRGIQRDQVDKARQFAAMYNNQELKDLCSHNNEEGKKRLTKSHVIRLLSVRSKRTRAKLAKQVVQNGWSVQRLGQELTKSGKSSQGGRRPKRPATVDEALHQIERITQPFINWISMMEDGISEQGVGLDDLPAPMVKALRKMAQKAGEVIAAADS